MRTPCSRVLTRDALRIAGSITLVLLCCSCEERNKLASEIAAVKRDISEMQPKYSETQQELTRTNKALQSLLISPSVRKTGPANIEQEVAELAQKKDIIDTEIAVMKQDFEAYRKENP